MNYFVYPCHYNFPYIWQMPSSVTNIELILKAEFVFNLPLNLNSLFLRVLILLLIPEFIHYVHFSHIGIIFLALYY